MTAAIFFLPDLRAGGAQRGVVDVLAHWPAGPERPLLALGARVGGGAGWLDAGIETVDLGAPRLRDAILKLRRLVAMRRPRVLVSTMPAANVAAVVATSGLADAPRHVLCEVNSHRLHDALGWPLRRLLRWAYARAERVVALSRGLAAELESDYALPAGSVVAIPNPIDVEAWRRRAAAATASPWPPGPPVILGAGRLVRQKGFAVLLDAFASVARRRPLRLVLIGEGPERPRLAAQARALGVADAVTLAGHADDPAGWFRHCALFVLSSRWEGFGNVVAEAMACGAPVIATRCPHGPDEIVADGVTGRLVAPENAEALASAIVACLDDPAGSAARAAAGAADVERFAALRVAARWATLLERIGEDRRDGA